MTFEHSLFARRWASCGALDDGRMLVACGWDENGPLNDVLVVDAKRKSVSSVKLALPPSPRRWCAAEMIENKLVLCGGYNGTTLSDSYCADLVAGKWFRLPFELARSRHTLCDGWVVGGFCAAGKVEKAVCKIAGLNEPLVPVPNAPYLERAGHTMTKVGPNDYLVVGGFVKNKQLVGDAVRVSF